MSNIEKHRHAENCFPPQDKDEENPPKKRSFQWTISTDDHW